MKHACRERIRNSLPYGQTNVNGSNDNFPFTDHERDAENGSDATLFRHYSPARGRWLSPDPYNGSIDLTDPQSFNRYSYVSNRPMASVDQYGLDDDDDGCDPDSCGYTGGDDDGGDPTDADQIGETNGYDFSNFSQTTINTSSGAAYAEAYLSYGNLQASLSSTTFADTALNAISVGLNVLSFLPGAGALPDGINAVISLARGNTREAGLYTVAAVKIFEAATRAEKLEQAAQAGIALNNARRLGEEGEAAVKATNDIGDRLGFTVNGRNRVSDGFNSNQSITEVKNVGKLAYTQQLKDYVAFTKGNIGLQFYL